MLLAFALAACSTPPPNRPVQSGPTRHLLEEYPGYQPTDRQRLNPIQVAASSNYSSTTPEEGVDNNLNTQWASGGYQDRRAFYWLDFGTSVYVSYIRIKTGPTNGSRYQVELSQDGSNWVAVTDWLENSTWTMERKRVRAHGRYMRIRWRNSEYNPQNRFSIFEVHAYGSANVLPYGQPVAQGAYDDD
jgi:hypothetical protein